MNFIYDLENFLFPLAYTIPTSVETRVAIKAGTIIADGLAEPY